MKTHNLLLSLCSVVSATACLTSCSKDKEPASGTDPKFDDLAIFQDYFVHLDKDGNFAARSQYGTPLDPSDSTHLFIGVDDLNEACELFQCCCSSESIRNSSPGGDMEFTPTDKDNKAQGLITFTVLDSGQESLAEITFSQDTKLKYISKISFIPATSSLWGAKWHSPYKFGDVTDHWNGIEEASVKYLCIRAAKPGQKGMCVHISVDPMYPGDEEGCSWTSSALTISRMFTEDNHWDSFANMFKTKCNATLRSDIAYWIDQWKTIFFRYGIWLKEGKTEWFQCIKRPRKPLLSDFQFEISN